MSLEDIQYFKERIESVTESLLSQSEKWINMVSDDNLPEEVKTKIYSVHGKSHLLVNSKFKQFRELLNDVENNKLDKMVLTDDLHGFWETMYIQVKQIQKCFDELDRLEKNSFVVSDECILTTPSKSTKKKPVKETCFAVSQPNKKATSNLRNFIAEQRAKLKSENV